MKDDRDSVTQDQPGDPKNVGKSTTRKGEDVITRDGKEPGRYDTEEKGAGRPAGKSTLRDVTGVDPKKQKS
jgi:hypothetical protein